MFYKEPLNLYFTPPPQDAHDAHHLSRSHNRHIDKLRVKSGIHVCCDLSHLGRDGRFRTQIFGDESRYAHLQFVSCALRGSLTALFFLLDRCQCQEINGSADETTI